MTHRNEYRQRDSFCLFRGKRNFLRSKGEAFVGNGKEQNNDSMFIGLILGAFFGSVVEDTLIHYFTPPEEQERRKCAIKFGPDQRHALDLAYAPEEMTEALVTLNRYRRYYSAHFEYLCTMIESLTLLYRKREKALRVAATEDGGSASPLPLPMPNQNDTELNFKVPPMRDLYPSEVVYRAQSICKIINRQSNDMLRAFVKQVKNDPEDRFHHDLKTEAKKIYDANVLLEQCLNEVLSDLRFELMGAT